MVLGSSTAGTPNGLRCCCCCIDPRDCDLLLLATPPPLLNESRSIIAVCAYQLCGGVSTCSLSAVVVVERGQFPARANSPPLNFIAIQCVKSFLLHKHTQAPSVFLQSHLQRIKSCQRCVIFGINVGRNICTHSSLYKERRPPVPFARRSPDNTLELPGKRVNPYTDINTHARTVLCIIDGAPKRPKEENGSREKVRSIFFSFSFFF